jgi:hypothetical protein
MSPYERRRGGNAPPGGLRGRPGAGNTRSGQRGSGHSVATTVGRQPDTELGSAGPASWRRGVANSTASGRRVRQHRSFAPWGKARPEKWRAEPRPEPDSGNPTVRDRRGASGNVASWSMISTRRARLISISTRARWDLRGGRRATGVPTAIQARSVHCSSGCRRIEVDGLGRGGVGRVLDVCHSHMRGLAPQVPDRVAGGRVSKPGNRRFAVRVSRFLRDRLGVAMWRV